MPLGEIKPRELTKKEIKWRKGWKRWEGHELKDMLPTMRRMSQEEYRAFVYGCLDPRTALLIATEPGFREVLEYQLTKRWYHEWRDTACRFLKR